MFWQTKSILVKHLIYREEYIALVFLPNALSLNLTENIVIAVSSQELIDSWAKWGASSASASGA